jgi:hypothetical protein
LLAKDWEAVTLSPVTKAAAVTVPPELAAVKSLLARLAVTLEAPTTFLLL